MVAFQILISKMNLFSRIIDVWGKYYELKFTMSFENKNNLEGKTHMDLHKPSISNTARLFMLGTDLSMNLLSHSNPQSGHLNSTHPVWHAQTLSYSIFSIRHIRAQCLADTNLWQKYHRAHVQRITEELN